MNKKLYKTLLLKEIYQLEKENESLVIENAEMQEASERVYNCVDEYMKMTKSGLKEAYIATDREREQKIKAALLKVGELIDICIPNRVSLLDTYERIRRILANVYGKSFDNDLLKYKEKADCTPIE